MPSSEICGTITRNYSSLNISALNIVVLRFPEADSRSRSNHCFAIVYRNNVVVTLSAAITATLLQPFVNA